MFKRKSVWLLRGAYPGGKKRGGWEINEGPIATHLAVGVEPWTRAVAGAEGKHSKLMSGSKFVGKDI